MIGDRRFVVVEDGVRFEQFDESIDRIIGRVGESNVAHDNVQVTFKVTDRHDECERIRFGMQCVWESRGL